MSEGRAKRERVAVVAYAPEAAKEEEEEAVGATGTGTPLGDIEFIKESIGKKAADDEALTKLHSVCFGKPGQKQARKKALRAFNGFATKEEGATKLERLVGSKKNTVGLLKDICGVLGLQHSGSKDDLGKRICDFLADPSGDAVTSSSGGKKRKTPAASKKGEKGKKAKKAKDPNKKKRPLSAYMNFSVATRPSVVAKNPGIAFGAVGTEIARLWHLLSDEEKAAYKSEPVEEEPAAAEEEEEPEEEEEEEEEDAEEDAEEAAGDAEEAAASGDDGKAAAEDE